MPRSTCMKCGEVFKSVSSFDKHRTGNHGDGTRRCLTVDEMVSQGMLKNDKGEWISSVYDFEREAKDRPWRELTGIPEIDALPTEAEADEAIKKFKRESR